MKKKISLILLFAICFVGCFPKGSERAAGNAGKDWSEKTAFVMSVRGSETENGVILNGGDQYLYYEEESRILIPLCNRADCDHSSADTCTAWLLMDQSTGVIGYYDGYLWFFWEHEGEVTLRRANVDGSNQKDLFQVDIGIEGAECRIYQGILYLVDSRIDFTEDPTVKVKNRIAAIDLNTGEVEGITEETEDMLLIRGMRENFLYFQLYYLENSNESNLSISRLYCYDCDTKEMMEIFPEEIDLGYAVVGDDYLAYYISEGELGRYYIIDPDTGEALMSFKSLGLGLPIPFEDQFLVIYDNGECYRFQATDRTETHIDHSKAEEYHFVWAVEGGYLVKIIGDNGITNQYAFLSEDALLNDKEAEILKLGESP